MAKKKKNQSQQSSKKKKSSGGQQQSSQDGGPDGTFVVEGDGDGDGFIMVDPARVRFQHSRIRPYFSGCGRSLMETLDEIRDGKIKPSDLPPIQVTMPCSRGWTK